MNNIIQRTEEFKHWLLELGIDLPKKLAKGKINRCPAPGKGADNTSLLIELNSDATRGHVHNYVTNEQNWWSGKKEDDDTFSLTPAQIKNLERERRMLKNAEVWENDEHFYAAKKGIVGNYKVLEEKIIVPAYRDQKLATTQKIDDNGKKMFAKGCSSKGIHHLIGDPTAKTATVAEGWATGMRIHQATQTTVYVTFSASNLKTFDPPDHIDTLLVGADNDAPAEGKTSGAGQLAAATLMARLKNKNVVCHQMLPPTQKTDWADYPDAFIKESWDKTTSSGGEAFKLHTTAEDVEIEYLHNPYIPSGQVIGFYGRGGTAKSTMISTLTASKSRNYSTLWITSEENRNDVLLRFQKSNGQKNSVAVVDGSGFDVYLHLESCLKKAKDGLKNKLGFVVLDAIGSLVSWPKGENSNDDTAVKKLLSYLKQIAETEKLSILIVRHAGKGRQDHHSDKVLGARAWVDSPRLCYMLANSSTQEHGGVIRTIKNNLTPPFLESFSTKPVYYMKANIDGVKPALCKIDFNDKRYYGQNEVEVVYEELTNIGAQNPKQNERENRLLLIGDAIKELVTKNKRTTRKEIEKHIPDIQISKHDWQDIDAELKRFDAGILIERGPNNTRIYAHRPKKY